MPKIIDEDDVFKAVMALLVVRGYAGTTTSDMAAAANMHEATLFRKYGSKVGLIERAIEHQLGTTPMSQLRYSGDLRTDLLEILKAYRATVEMHGEIMSMILVEIPRHPELMDTMQTPLANIQTIMHIIERYRQEGHLKKEPAMVSVSALLAPLMVNKMFSRVSETTAAPAIDLENYVDAYLQGRRSQTDEEG